MNYPQSFKDKCKRTFPSWEELHSHAEQGHEIVGRYLDDSNNGSISVKIVLDARTLDELKELAKRETGKMELYSEWWELYRKETGM